MDISRAIDGIPIVSSSTERAALFAVPATNQRVHNLSTGNIERWTGTAWVVDFLQIVTPQAALVDGITDDAVAVQAAINAVRIAGGGTVRFLPGIYAIGTTLKIGDAGVTAEGVILEAARLGVRSTGATLKWIGATGGDAAILSIRNAMQGAIRGLGFDANNKADYCVQVRHVAGDLDVAEHWKYDQCMFTAARKYNVLIGEIDSNVSSGDESVQNFFGCYFRRDSLGLAATTAHVRVRSANTLPVNFWGCQFDAGTNPTYHLSTDSGFNNVYVAVAVGNNNNTVFMETAAGQVPPCLCVYSWESQDTNFMRATMTSSMQRSTVLVAVRHAAIQGTPGDAIQWSQNSGHGGLVLDGCRFDKAVNIQTSNAIVSSHGTIFADSTQAFTGNPQVVTGDWGTNLGYNYQVGTGASAAFDQTNSVNRLQGTPITVLANGVIPLAAETAIGHLIVSESGGSMAIYVLRGTGHIASEGMDLLGAFSVTPGSANQTNIYWSAGNNRYELENKWASTRIYRITFIGHGG